MNTAVLKFGGSTFPDPGAYATIAAYLGERIEARERLVVTVSAAPGETERLRSRLHEVARQPREETVAGLLTLADTVSAHLLAAAVTEIGRSATVLAGHQMGFVTTGSPMWARLKRMDRASLDAALAECEVVILPGGQAVDESGRPTWLGKNSSDLTAIAAAATLGVPRCEIYSDVEGIYSADPHLVPDAHLVPEISYDSVVALSARGARVLYSRAVRMADRHGVTIACRLNRPPYRTGTVITDRGAPVSAVVVNPNAVVIRFPGSLDADHAFAALHQEGIEAIRIEDDGSPYVVIVNGFVDAARLLAEHDLPGEIVGRVPVTTVQGSSAQTRLAPDLDSAIDLARKLHAEVTGASFR